MSYQGGDGDGYFDMRNLASPPGEPGACPVAGCVAPLGKAASQWGEMPYCPVHRIRIHAGTRTFVYYNGSDGESKHQSALRNILFERQYFGSRFLGNAAKAETHRICHETSEDALTWNVFASLARAGRVATLLTSLAGSDAKSEPDLYLWGLRVRLDDPSPPSLFPSLQNARSIVEKGITKFLTEPDIMLHIPGQVLVLIEAKFTSGNTVASASTTHDLAREKPKSREGILRRYPATALPPGALIEPPSTGPFYSQLYRNLVFAIHMAKQLGVRWALVSLVSEGQRQRRLPEVEYQDPTPFIHSLLPEEARNQFRFYSWERLYADHVVHVKGLEGLAAYMYHKSANGERALAV